MEDGIRRDVSPHQVGSCWPLEALWCFSSVRPEPLGSFEQSRDMVDLSISKILLPTVGGKDPSREGTRRQLH